MKEDTMDVVKILEEKRNFHLEQVRRINLALEALAGDTATQGHSRGMKKILWSSAIDRVFEQYDQLTLEEVRQRLAEQGIPQALEAGYRSTIYSTLERKARKDLEKTGNTYKLRTGERRKPKFKVQFVDKLSDEKGESADS